jgi:hypothetical protein
VTRRSGWSTITAIHRIYSVPHVIITSVQLFKLSQSGSTPSPPPSTAETASLKRATVSAANISPVPLKKQSSAGTSIHRIYSVPHVIITSVQLFKLSQSGSTPSPPENFLSRAQTIHCGDGFA